MNHPFSLESYVTILQNNSSYSPDEIISVCKRVANSKRDFLFVNHLQGKHIPVSPMQTFQLYNELVNAIISAIDPNEEVIVIGFAETATAIAHFIASVLPNCFYRMQTTREILEGITPLVEFKEEHSHATEQVMYGTVAELSKYHRIIFVDDEISTGNTILNFIYALEKVGVHAKYGVASILNLQNEAWTQKFKELHIDTYYVLRGQLKDLSSKVPIEGETSSIVPKNLTDLGNYPLRFELSTNITNFTKERLGSRPYVISDFSALDMQLGELFKGLNSHAKSILVLGTEEYMFIPMILAKLLEEKTGVNVKFHATTRSPIETSDEAGYAIKSKYSIRSPYDVSRQTFIYNLTRYDKVYVVTDVTPTQEFIKDISAALLHAGTSIEHIVFISLKG